MKKKIVLAIFTLQGNGAERFALTLAKGIAQAGHEAHLVYFKHIIDLPIPDNIHLHFFDYQKYRAIPKFMRAGFAAKAFDKFVIKHIGTPDLVLSNLYPVDFILAKSQLANVHLIIHNTTSIEYQAQLNDAKFLQKLKSTYLLKPCIGVSEGVTQDFRQLFGEQSQIQTIYNPIDVDDVLNAAQEYVPEYQNYIVHVGKFKLQKRHDILIRAYALANVEEKLILVGTGELMQQNQQLVKELNIEDKVIFAGFQKNPYPWIKNAKLMVMSSDFEGLGLVILEAVVLDVPVISTNCPSGPAEILSQLNLSPVADIQALAQKIKSATINSKQFKTELLAQFYLAVAVKQYLKLSI